MWSVKLVPPQKPNLNTKVKQKYQVTLSRKSQGQGHNSVEFIKVQKPTKHQVWIGLHHTFKAIHKHAKVNISVCSLKREVKVKVTKFCASLEELINVYKLSQFDSCIINSLWETKLNATAKRNCWRRTDGRTDRQTDGFCQFIDRTCFAIRSKIRLQNGTKNNNTSKHMLLDYCYEFGLLL